MSQHSDHIAVVGAALRAPGAASLEQYWQNLAQGVESIRLLNDEELLALGVPAGQLGRPRFVKAGAVLENADCFDAAYFGFNRRQALVLDPQHRLMLETAVEAFEHAGCDPAQFQGEIGTYLSAASNDYGRRSQRPGEPTETFLSFTSNDVDFIATRVAYKLGLTGPSYSVQSACSSSLVAVHQACEALRNYEIDMALAGGVSLLFPQAGYVFHPDMILSPDGHCRAFDEKAAGTVFGNGAGVVVLKRLDDALADGDRVLAVVKGSAINNDGAGKVDYYAPSVQGQRQAINAALVAAGVHPDTIGCVEAHGTGTPLGDPIEIEALTQAYRAYTARTQFCAIGSVKTNIGHLNTAAGIAGFIKTVLMLERGLIPPSLNFGSPNPRIDFAASPFFVNDRLRPWTRGEAPRRAAVSAFGIGGTNAHVILEEAPARSQGVHEAIDPQLLILSAMTEAAAARQVENLLAWLGERPDALLADVAYTLQVGRRALPWRVTLVGRSVDHVCRQLREQRPPPRLAGRDRSAVPAHQVEAARKADPAQRELLLAELATRWLEGASIDWKELHAGQGRSPLPLPTYPFERERYWLEAGAGAATAMAAPGPPAARGGVPMLSWPITGWTAVLLYRPPCISS